MPRSPKDSGSKKHARLHKAELVRNKIKKTGKAVPALKSRAAAVNKQGRVSLTSAKKVAPGAMRRLGRPVQKEAPGPKYIPVNQTQPRQQCLEKQKISQRIAVVDLARIDPVDLADIFVELGILPDMMDTCPTCEEGTMRLTSRKSQGKPLVIAGHEFPAAPTPIWRCDNWECQRRVCNLDPDGPLSCLFNKGTINSTKTLLAIAHILSRHSSSYFSSTELACQAGISAQAAQNISDTLRKLLAEGARREQNDFKWTAGSLIEADEASMRVTRVSCPRDCRNPSCGNHPFGFYRLLHRRIMCVSPRGQRDLAMFFELPAETCEAGAGGVPLSATECDDILSWVLVPGNFTLLTDGAGAYQSVAPMSRVSYHTEGQAASSFNQSRFEEHYKHLQLSHGIVSHDAEQWATVSRVRVISPDGKRKTLALKKGTQVVDGLWPELRSSIPDPVSSTDWERCSDYMWAWVWSMRRARCDLLVEFGKLARLIRAQ